MGELPNMAFVWAAWVSIGHLGLRGWLLQKISHTFVLAALPGLKEILS